MRLIAMANDSGVLCVAAAGNDGNKKNSYPASYPMVVSVAAVDSNGDVADFSQHNRQVELAGPGVGVLSTVPMGTATIVDVTVDGTNIIATGMEGSGEGTAKGNLVDCGLGDGKSPCDADGLVCLIQRGDISFADKAQFCEENNGTAAIIYNNDVGIFYGLLGDTPSSILAVGISDVNGEMLMTTEKLNTEATVSLAWEGNYDYYSGTSMVRLFVWLLLESAILPANNHSLTRLTTLYQATPHVSAAAALVWLVSPSGLQGPTNSRCPRRDCSGQGC